MVSQMQDFTSSRAFRVAGPKAFAEAGITHKDVDHLMIYDAPCSLPRASFAHLPIYGLEDLGFVPRGDGQELAPAEDRGRVRLETWERQPDLRARQPHPDAGRHL